MVGNQVDTITQAHINKTKHISTQQTLLRHAFQPKFKQTPHTSDALSIQCFSLLHRCLVVHCRAIRNNESQHFKYVFPATYVEPKLGNLIHICVHSDGSDTDFWVIGGECISRCSCNSFEVLALNVQLEVNNRPCLPISCAAALLSAAAFLFF